MWLVREFESVQLGPVNTRVRKRIFSGNFLRGTQRQILRHSKTFPKTSTFELLDPSAMDLQGCLPSIRQPLFCPPCFQTSLPPISKTQLYCLCIYVLVGANITALG